MPRDREGLLRVHGVEVDRRGLLVVLVKGGLAREEEDARHRRGDGAAERGDGRDRDVLRWRLRAGEAVLHHVGLEDGALEVDLVKGERAELRRAGGKGRGVSEEGTRGEEGRVCRWVYSPLCVRTCATRTFSVTSWQTEIGCEPLGTISGSTIGTSLLRWQIAAYWWGAIKRRGRKVGG